MTPLPASASAERVLAILRQRDGVATSVELVGGRVCEVFNVAWGQDDGEVEYHVTGNISPAIEGADVEFFMTDQVVGLRDPKTGGQLR